MGYCYADERNKIFTEDGQVMFLSIRDTIPRITDESGACTIASAMCGQSGGVWQMLACVDRLVELGEIAIIENPHGKFHQHNIIFRIGK